MSQFVKYTKTSTFLFPLLCIPKGLFYCNVKNSFDKVLMTTRFLNAYLLDSDLNNEEYNNGPYVYIVIKPYQDADFDAFYNTILSYENYVDEYEKLDYIVMIFRIPNNFIEDYDKILNGKYSEISKEARALIMGNCFFSSKPKFIPMILSKSIALKKSWEERLTFIGPDIYSPADLGDQEVWGIITKDKEALTIEKLKEMTKSYKMKAVKLEDGETFKL
jgi:hypothetical protein